MFEALKYFYGFFQPYVVWYASLMNRFFGPTFTKQDLEAFNIDVKKAGVGSTPATGDFVTVKYTGMLPDGTVFDSTKDRGDFEFIVGISMVIPCWDRAFLQMSEGEKARITCPPALAYGKDGAPPTIPPNSALVFDVELIKV